MERIRQGVTKKWAMEFLEKITVYPNEAIHDDYVIVFTGGYEKIANENQPQRMYAKWVFHIIIKLFYKNFKRIAKPRIPIISINIIKSKS